jgi:mannitol 2-dehydrogenase
MDIEVTPLLPTVPGIDIETYKENLLERFANPAIKDQLSRLATEGSARIPKFILPSITEQLERGGPIRLLSFVVACWFRFLAGTDERGRELTIIDSMADRLKKVARLGGTDPRALLGLRELFDDRLSGSKVFLEEMDRALTRLHKSGARAALVDCVGSG